MKRPLPDGIVSMLFTDIEGSTATLRELGDAAYGRVLAEHHRLCRGVWEESGGIEVDTAGDGFFVVFRDPRAAVAAAGRAQEVLADLPVRARMGIHTGLVAVNETGYHGFEVHKAARIASAAHGGQVLVSAATAALTGGESLRSLGLHRFRDVPRPEEVFQAGGGEFPRIRSLGSTNLPSPVTAFLGRGEELAEAELALASTRLLTVIGPGGAGKTRFAIELAQRVASGFADGVVWVPLASLAAADLVSDTIAQVLEAHGDPEHAIGPRELLLVLDNFEHVIAAAPMVARLVGACPNLKIVVTSRELLRVGGETRFELSGLPPEEAVGLFLARAEQVQSSAVAEICERLDRMPLAIELAAARTGVLTPEQLLDRLGSRLDLLRGGRDADARQQTLRATISWSFDLLDAAEQRLFARLSAFPGGCTLETAEIVCDADIDTLQSLLDKSLIRRSGSRYWQLETIRAFAAEQLAALDDDTDRRMIDHYCDVVIPLARARAAWMHPAYFDDEIDNVRRVLDHLAARGDGERFGWVVCGLAVWWTWRGHLAEASGRLGEALGMEPLSPALEAELFERSAEVAMRNEEIQDHATKALGRFEQLGDVHGQSLCLDMIGWCRFTAGDRDGGLAQVRRAVDLAAGVDANALAMTRLHLAAMLEFMDQLEEADELARLAYNVLLECAVPAIAAWPLIVMGAVARRRGHLDEARRLLRASHEWSEAGGLITSRVEIVAELAFCLHEQQCREEAARLLGVLDHLVANGAFADPDTIAKPTDSGPRSRGIPPSARRGRMGARCRSARRSVGCATTCDATCVFGGRCRVGS